MLDKNNYIVAPKDSCFIIQSSGVNNTYNEDRCPKHVHRKLFISRQTSKKKNFFIKFDRRVKQIIGCQRATLILGALEYWFIKKPDGFYKFMEPCSHRLYREGDSWAEELGFERRCFARAFQKIGIKYNSRRAFEQAEDKFEGKLYASYYDRYSNRTFFIRNHDLVNETLKGYFKTKSSRIKKAEGFSQQSADTLPKRPLSTGHNGRSYIEAKNTSNDLSKDKSHASEDIVKKMIEFWTALVEGGGEQIELTNRRVAFLKKALVDKFDGCLEKWKKYCQDIASSRFLMGEVKSSFRATLDWALKFDVIQKILEGCYGIGDRTPKAILPSQSDLQEKILTAGEPQEIKDFRTLCLQTVGNANYISYFQKLTIEFREGGEIALIAAHKFGAEFLERNCYSYLRLILQKSGDKSKKITILAPGEDKGRLIERDGGTNLYPILLSIPAVEHPTPEKLIIEKITTQDEPVPEVSLETNLLRKKLSNTIPPQQFPGWLGDIEVESINQDGTIIVTFEDQLMVDYCEVRFNQQILGCSKEIWQNIKGLVIRGKSEYSRDLECSSFQNMLPELHNTLESKSLKEDAEFLMGMAEPKGEVDVLEDESVPEVSLETRLLRKKLREHIPFQQFPGWLGAIEVESINQDGTVVVTFKDQLAVDWCRSHFSREVLESATVLWGGVNRLLICERRGGATPSSIRNNSNTPKIVGEQSMFEQAIQSFLAACSFPVGTGDGGGGTRPSFC